ncbi:hypothetical protein BKA61DRAFT_667110 [Leptodontidium sp. MPI-SDFR-AT-0119]|nr:hypothetical protein BKA61DRAFT_667110 [Leptodontidium sp. MPI-SDFR-AT-0119]
MAKDMQTKKRKASVPEVEAEKVKKVKNVGATPTEAPAKKRKATEDAAPAKVKKTKTPKNASEAKTSTSTTTDKAPKTAKVASTTATSTDKMKGPKEIVTAAKKAITSTSKTVTAVSEKVVASKKKIAKSAKPEIEVDEEMDSGLEDEDKDMDGDSDSEADEETQNILDGFESEGDDEEIADGLPEGAEVPVRKQLGKKEEKKLKKMNESGASDKPGVVYVGRIPHGFYENEMRAYFGQFGTILKLRLSRNKKTGASKHFAWIQFESAGVADIVARTMDNYMMFSHLLKVKLIPDEQVNPDWFKGANKRFKKVPWNKMEGRKLEQGKSEEAWNAKVERETGKREKRASKMKEIGYEFEAPKLKSAAGLAKPKAPEELTNSESDIKAIENAPVRNDDIKSKKGEKSKGTIYISPPDPLPETNNKEEKRAIAFPPSKEDAKESLDALVAEAAAKGKNGKKGKKAKAVKETQVAAEEAVEVVEEPKPKKEKKSEKPKTVKTTIPEPAVEAPEKKVKTKKSKSSLVETTVTPVIAPEETAKKSKKGKKGKDSA